MAITFRSFVRPIILSSFCAVLTLQPGSPTAKQTGAKAVVAAPIPQIVAASDHSYYPVVRLRKLHLVRPDLIPYPIYYAIYC